MAHIDTKVLTAHIPVPLADKVDLFATRLERSRGWIIKQALTAWIDQEEERSRLTREALADVDQVRSLITNRFRLGPIVSVRHIHCQHLANGTEMDK